MTFHGSYEAKDVTFLLKPANIHFTDINEKERSIQSGARHYSEMLSAETVPDNRYLGLYDEALQRNAGRLKADIDRLAILVASATSNQPVIVSLARAGTPIGVLLSRRMRSLGMDAPHYSVSIIRDRGIDTVALKTIVERHGSDGIMFVDGWTGKGAIMGELKRTLAGAGVGARLAVVADPAGCATMAATTDDYVIPSGILNGIVSGLISRTVLNDEVVGAGEYHACLHQTHLAEHDRSRAFIETIERSTPEQVGTVWSRETAAIAAVAATACIERMKDLHGITNVNRIKPGIAEATRAILRRLPDAVHVRDPESADVRHIVHIARQAGVPMLPLEAECPYGAITIIKGLGDVNDNRMQRFGATLYVPAIHHTLDDVRKGSVDGLGSMVICLEDSIRDDQVEMAIDHLRRHLVEYEDGTEGPVTYVRPRNPDMAMRIMAMEGAESLRGFVIPKATPETLPEWISAMRGSSFAVMPTLETVHAFDVREVHRLRDQTLAMSVPVDMVRIGGNDILASIGARRSNARTLYEGPLGPVVACVVGAFAGTGIMLSSPVLEHYSHEQLLLDEITMDVEHGIYNKTAIHPRQVAIINDGLRPSVMEVAEARAILDVDAAGVFGRDGSMCEPKTHAAWARGVLARRSTLGTHTADVATAV